MPRIAPAVAVCFALAPLGAAAQNASGTQTSAVSEIAQCLAVGLPAEWKRLQMVIELPRPMSETGGVLYLVTMPDDRVQPFQPCDPGLPPRRLIATRDAQPEKEQGWTKATLTMQPDASFDLKYEYPQPAKK
jgi:hypothetical protein